MHTCTVDGKGCYSEWKQLCMRDSIDKNTDILETAKKWLEFTRHWMSLAGG